LESGTNELEVMEFTICDQHFGINVAKIFRLVMFSTATITPMPNSNPFIEGVFKSSDEIITVVNLAAYMGLPPSANDERDILVITNFNKINSAFHIHDVSGIHRISWTDIEKPDKAIYGGEDGLATGIARYDNRLITIIDFEKIIADISPSAGIQLGDVDRLGAREKIAKPIMIVEDSTMLERVISESFERAGFGNIIYFQNGEEAWSGLKAFKYTGKPINEQICAVVTDIEMPRMDGHRLLKMIRDDNDLKNLPVFIFSSLITDEMRFKGETLGATGQVTKPDVADLIALIDKHI
ncbi:MAG: chemotaxis protein, partial [Defluviitaleaceae bacterium]|nr:chemotaxis protein [Defluviitaleaceae bacterium]